jgi:hypothetical protein
MLDRDNAHFVVANELAQFEQELSRLVAVVWQKEKNAGRFTVHPKLRHERGQKLTAIHDALRKALEQIADPDLQKWLEAEDWAARNSHPHDPGLVVRISEVQLRIILDLCALSCPLPKGVQFYFGGEKYPRGSGRQKERPAFDRFVAWVFEAARRHNVKLTIASDVKGEAGGTLPRLLRRLQKKLPPKFVPDTLKATSLRRAIKQKLTWYPLDRVEPLA